MDRLKSVNLTAIMEREGIASITRWRVGNCFTVELFNGHSGRGGTVGEALADAKANGIATRVQALAA